MYRELRKFKAISGEYATILSETSRSIDNVERAVASVHEDGASTLIALGERIDAAQRTISTLETAEATASARLRRLQSKIEDRQAAKPEPKIPVEKTTEPEAPAMPTVTPIFARSLRTRKTVEWPVVKSASLTAHEA